MAFLHIIAVVCIIIQVLFVFQIFSHYKYVLKKFAKRHNYRPKVALIVPCKGIDTAFDKNISSFYQLEYDNYELIFVTESSEDAAYSHLLGLKDRFQNRSKAFKTSVLIAGMADQGSQKLHNMLYACGNAGKDAEVFAFADSDACLRGDWLGHLVYPLRKEKHGVSTGYRWYVPLKNNLATLALSAMNAKVAQFLGPTIFNCAWGGSMAVRVNTFKKLEMDKIWRKAISDDLTLSREAKKAKLKVIFAPGCLVASYEQTNWRNLFEFARRQFIITRVTVPGTWWFGFFSSVFSVLGLWGFTGLAIFSYLNGLEYRQTFLTAAIIFLAGQTIRAFLRQKMIFRLLAAETAKMKAAALTDIIGGSLWSLILFFCILSSAFGSIITWRGVKYKLTGPTEVIRLAGDGCFHCR
ncbi:MAG: glycosyltransferase family 2 protein [Sedimentisphaerales bacterium]